MYIVQCLIIQTYKTKLVKWATQKFIFIIISLITCSFCGKNFEVINRHLWRCKSKNQNNDQGNANPEIENNGSEIEVVTTKTLYVPVGKYARAMLVFGVTKELAK